MIEFSAVTIKDRLILVTHFRAGVSYSLVTVITYPIVPNF
jgi:hypothetical protein